MILGSVLCCHSVQKTDDEVVLELAAEVQKRLPVTVEVVEEETTPGGTSHTKLLQLTLKALVNRDVNTKGLDKEKVNSQCLQRLVLFLLLLLLLLLWWCSQADVHTKGLDKEKVNSQCPQCWVPLLMLLQFSPAEHSGDHPVSF